MALNSDVADDSVLYPSLHQIYFSTVASLYIFICAANNGTPTDKYFTQISKLYKEWSRIHVEQKEMYYEIEAELVKKNEMKKEKQLK